MTRPVRHGGVVDGFAHKPVLTGERVVLRPYRPSDLDGLMAAMADRDVLRLTGSVHSADEPGPQVDDTIRAWYASRGEQTDRLDLMVVERETGRCVGEVVLNRYDPGNRSCNFRIMIGPAGQDRGLGSETVRMILDHAFTTLPLHRIELEVYDFNPRAQRVYARAGFRVEGRRRDALCYDGQWVDAIVMAVLSTDPRPAGPSSSGGISP